MQAAEEKLGLDSNVVSYLATAMSGVYDPANDVSALRDERIAAYRVFLYDQAVMCFTPTVKLECADVPQDRLKKLHDAISNVLLLDGPWRLNERRLNSRVASLLPFHRDANDCRILAEAEQAEFKAVLTFDMDFIKNLAGRSAGPVLRSPSGYWKQLAIPPGARTRREPAVGNPMRLHRWWEL